MDKFRKAEAFQKCAQAHRLFVGPVELGDMPLVKPLTWSFCIFTTEQNLGAQGHLLDNLSAPGSDFLRGTLSPVICLKSHRVLY